jgi:hypothetical protein
MTHSPLPELAITPLLLFSWFAPEIESENRSLFNVIRRSFKTEIPLDAIPADLRWFLKHFDRLRQDDWHLLRERRSSAMNSNRLTQIISDDDIEIFEELSSDVDFDWNQTLQPSIYDIHWIMAGGVSLLDCASYFGASRIFRHLLIRNEDDLSHPFGQSPYQAIHYAVAGGHPEIIRLLADRLLTMDGALHVAAQFHRAAVFDWIVGSTRASTTDRYDPHGTVVKWASLTMNIEVVRSCGGVTPVRVKPLVFFAVRFCHLELLKFVVEEFHVDLLMEQNGETLLRVAVTAERPLIVKYLLEQCPELANVLYKGSELPVWTAAYLGNQEITQMIVDIAGLPTSRPTGRFKDPFAKSDIRIPNTRNPLELCLVQTERKLSLVRGTPEDE